LLGLLFNLKTEAVCSSETSAEFQQITWRYIPEDRTLHNYHCEYLKSYKHKQVSFSSWIALCSSSLFSSIAVIHGVFSFQKILESLKERTVGRPMRR
jgi:hypothetical protein